MRHRLGAVGFQGLMRLQGQGEKIERAKRGPFRHTGGRDMKRLHVEYLDHRFLIGFDTLCNHSCMHLSCMNELYRGRKMLRVENRDGD